MTLKSADIVSLFGASEDLLRAKLRAIRASLHHASSKGMSVEDAIKDFLSDILPDNLGITSGIVIDSNLNASRQIDIIIYDKARTPTFFSAGGLSLIPIECVYFAIEVKTNLGRKEFTDAVENMSSIKALERRAYYFGNSPIKTHFSFFGNNYETHQTIFILFALDSASTSILLELAMDHMSKSPDTAKRIDAIYSLQSGCIINASRVGTDLKFDLLPWHSSFPALVEENALLTFISLFSRYYNQAEIGGKLDLTKYTHRFISKEVIVHSSLTEN